MCDSNVWACGDFAEFHHFILSLHIHPLALQAFDLLYLNGESLLKKTLAERQALLFGGEYIREVPGPSFFAQTRSGDNPSTHISHAS